MAQSSTEKMCPNCEEATLLPITIAIRNLSLRSFDRDSMKFYCPYCEVITNSRGNVLSMMRPNPPDCACNNTKWSKIEFGGFTNYVYKGRAITQVFYGRVCDCGYSYTNDRCVMMKRTGVNLIRQCPHCKKDAVKAKGNYDTLWLNCDSCYKNEKQPVSKDTEACSICNSQEWMTCIVNNKQLYLGGELWPHTTCNRCGTLSQASLGTYRTKCASLGLCIACNGKLVSFGGGVPHLVNAKLICESCRLVWTGDQRIAGTGSVHCETCNSTKVMPMVVLNSDSISKGTNWLCRVCPSCIEVVAVDKKGIERFRIKPLEEGMKCIRCRSSNMHQVMRVTEENKEQLVCSSTCLSCGHCYFNGEKYLEGGMCNCGSNYAIVELVHELGSLNVRKCTGCSKYDPRDIKLLEKHYTYLLEHNDTIVNPKKVQEVSRVPQQSKESKEDGMCVVCLSGKACIVLLDCWHMCLCEECSPDFIDKPCPMCRAPIKSMKKPYVA